MAGPHFQLDDDLRHVTVVFPTVPRLALKLDVAGVEDLLRNLGDFRSSMNQQVPKTFELGQKVGAVPDPCWVSEPELMHGASLIHLRDPRYGWLHFLLPRPEAAKLGTVLQRQAEIPPH
jgi:hypothetical protein